MFLFSASIPFFFLFFLAMKLAARSEAEGGGEQNRERELELEKAIAVVAECISKRGNSSKSIAKEDIIMAAKASFSWDTNKSRPKFILGSTAFNRNGKQLER